MAHPHDYPKAVVNSERETVNIQSNVRSDERADLQVTCSIHTGWFVH